MKFTNLEHFNHKIRLSNLCPTEEGFIIHSFKGHVIYHFARPFRCHHHYILSLPDQCLKGRVEDFKRNNAIMHFHYTTNMATP